MAFTFDDDVVTAVLRHMNDDHVDDNLLIVRAFGAPEAESATMSGFDGAGGVWSADGPSGVATPVRVPWPGGPITERGQVRREIVALYDAACTRLGIPPRPHS
ncbi:DUF2470 domain-containing protein [Microbacterium sp. LRZ72]|uniref:DUF2470 domain-containing protein n=1 Tax=Microbacterium sp. LRZ72 TaxID=2942481 RepID=UPI0029BEEC4D|nr:DUF2470 domain-containing protein [Microbacterium sp. LRZ72]MDX2376124.1 DUF2470 domain-containing protein [Microbacterium sp. LRZ72]